MTWYRIDLPYACAAIVVLGGRVVQAAPIFAWMLGKDGSTVRGFVARKHGTIEALP